MIATDFHLIPLAQLCKHESTVLARLGSLPIRYAESLLEEPEIRYPFLYYALFTHWPELLREMSTEEVLYNRYYWFLRMAQKYGVNHDFDEEFDQQITQMLEMGKSSFGQQILDDLEAKVSLEQAANEMELPVAFSDFSIRRVIKDLGVKVDETSDFFAAVLPLPVSPALHVSLTRAMRVLTTVSTEKARSESIVSPVLFEVLDQLSNKISLHSGVEWEVDDAKGLRGQCDFLMGLTSGPTPKWGYAAAA
jgi:hypothetical protein